MARTAPTPRVLKPRQTRSPYGRNIALALATGLLLRVGFILHAGHIDGDALLYGDIAKNWLDRGVYGFTQAAPLPPVPTLIRLPGYPAFLALCFAVFGRGNYMAVMGVQAVLDLGTCLLIAALAGRLFGRRAHRLALWLAALCPFTACYVAAPLAETMTLLCIAAAFYFFQRWQEAFVGRHDPQSRNQEVPQSWNQEVPQGRNQEVPQGRNQEVPQGREATFSRQAQPFNRWLFLLAATLTYAILLRPEQGLLAAAILPAMLWASFRPDSNRRWSALRKAAPTLAAALLIVLPLVPWTLRNWHTFHVFQPLAPRYATDPGEPVPLGFQRWYRTWAIDFTSTEDVYWNYDGERIDVADLPTRAFDSEAQYATTASLLVDYNRTTRPSAVLDARFEALAEQRIHANPIRYYAALPVARLLNMTLRPRTETLPTPLEWWKFRYYPRQTIFAVAWAGLNLAYFVFAGAGLRRWRRMKRFGVAWNGIPVLAWAMIASIALRALLLLTIDNSEPRYTLEFFPVLIVAMAALGQHPHSGVEASCAG